MNIKKKVLLYILLPLFILLTLSAYYRFVIQHDYLVSYEGDCDAYSESCYIYCEDDTCSEPFYYTVIERDASEVYELCGPDVTECDAAYECQQDVEYCEIYYCDPEIDGEDFCEYLGENDRPKEKTEEESVLLPSADEITNDNVINASTSESFFLEQESDSNVLNTEPINL